MLVKRFLLSALAAVCAVSLMLPAAFAHGGCHGRSSRPAARPCPVESCTTSGWHYHNRTLYCGHTHGQSLCDGSCHSLCTVKDCTLAGLHVHNGVTYCGFDHEDGWCDGSCAPLCTVKGCTSAGRHSHNGVVCCGYDHESGFCDGSCPVYQTSTSSGHHSGHHGGHH